MSYNYIGATGAIKTGNRTTRIFPSGLCCIQEQWVTRKGEGLGIGEGAILADPGPCIDNAYVFPAPEANEQGDGFTRWNVTAYGRSNTQGSTRYNRSIVSLRKIVVSEDGASATSIPGPTVQLDNPIVSVVLPSSESFDIGPISEGRIFDLTGKQIDVSSLDYTFNFGPFLETVYVSHSLRALMLRFDSVNYGLFNEYVISYGTQIVETRSDAVDSAVFYPNY